MVLGQGNGCLGIVGVVLFACCCLGHQSWAGAGKENNPLILLFYCVFVFLCFWGGWEKRHLVLCTQDMGLGQAAGGLGFVGWLFSFVFWGGWEFRVVS